MNNRIPAGVKSTLKVVMIGAFIALGCFIGYKISFFIAPFIVAMVIASMLEPFIVLLMRKLKMSRSVASASAMLSVILVFGSLITVAVVKLITEARDLSKILPKYVTDIQNNVNKAIKKGNDFYNWLPKEVTDNLGNVMTKLTEALQDFAGTIVHGMVNTAVSVPQAFIFVLVTIISTFFFASDRENIFNFFKSQIPDSWQHKIVLVKKEMFAALLGYIKAQLIMMGITFIELFVGLSVIHVKYSVFIALVVSVVDALPVLGSGSVLVPWAAYCFITGNAPTGFGILIIYGILLIIRQLIEPKILGSQLGVHPLLTLVGMYVGLKAFGIVGLIFGPIVFLMFKNVVAGALGGRSLRTFLERFTPRTDE